MDFNTEGLLLLTSDGPLAHALTHPSNAVSRVYRVKVSGRVDESWLARLRRGVDLEDGPAAAERVEVTQRLNNATWLEIEVKEGRNRLIRRLMEAGGYPVRRLVRLSYAGIELGGLKPGQVRKLTAGEYGRLRSACGLEGEVI
ncbi:MAG: rRNA pseudouridine synthase [Deltaproteobacteria bacterium]|nr:MAG: rRNA pseudouridine synthase [Deltaproteobacteria bacterium]